MKRHCILFAIIALFVPSILKAQTSPLSGLSSPKGVYVRFNIDYLANKVVGKSKYVVKRKKPTDNTYKTVGMMQMAQKYDEIVETVGRSELKDFERMKKITAPSQTIAFFNSNPTYKSISLFAELKIEFLQAFGFAFLDNSVTKNEFYNYAIYEVINKQETLIGEAEVFHNPKNYFLKQLTPQISKISGTDTSIFFQWDIQTPQYVDNSAEQVRLANLLEETFKQAPDNGNQRVDETTYQKVKEIYLKNESLLAVHPVDEFSTRFNIYYRKNNNASWILLEKKIANVTPEGKQVLFARIAGKHDDLVETMVIPQDEIYNTGDTSKIARGVIAHNGSVELIYSVTASDSTNSIILQWKKLPNKAYYSGIEISKSSPEMPQKVIQVLPTSATKYVDTEVYPMGTMFTYFVRPVFIPLQDLQQDIPASATMTCGKFSRPTAPFNLTVTNEGPHARLKWEMANENSIHSYFVYRGTSPNNMRPIRSAVKEREYLDTTGYLTGRVTYYYAIMAINPTQDTSDFSPKVMYTPIKKESFQAPSFVSSEIINGEANLSWNDVKLNDEFIAGYVVQRKIKGEKAFKNLHSKALNNANFIDTTFALGNEYIYRVASLSIKNDTSAFTPETVVKIEKPKEVLNAITDITLKNLSKTIRISWPSVEVGDVKGYKIYRKLPTEVNFKVIATLANGNFEYEDSKVSTNSIYVYSVTVLDSKNNESPIEERKSIYREPTKQ